MKGLSPREEEKKTSSCKPLCPANGPVSSPAPPIDRKDCVPCVLCVLCVLLLAPAPRRRRARNPCPP